MYKRVKIDITANQLKKALEGKPVQLKASQIGNGHALSLHPANIKIVEKAALAGRGCVIHMAPGELLSTAEDMNGEGIFGDIWKGLKSGYKWVKSNVIDSELYQKDVKPLVRKAVDMGLQYAKANNPQPEVNNLIDSVANKIGSKTGAYGVAGAGEKKKRATKKQNVEKLKGMGLYLS